jgi:CheY-like chemotaxis protein
MGGGNRLGTRTILPHAYTAFTPSLLSDADLVPSQAKIIQALDFKSLETIRLAESLSLDPADSSARAALTGHLIELRQTAAAQGLVHLEASLQTVLDRLKEESFSPASVHATRVLAHRYQELARIPSQSGTHPVVTGTVRPERRASLSLRGRRVMIADHDAEARWSYVGMLREAGARVVEATDGERALELARLAAPDLILADVLMPRLDGLAFCEAVRREPALDGVPVVLLSWRDDFLHRMRDVRAGAQDYLRKELPPRLILDRVSAVLEPLTRLEEFLVSGAEARGDLEELGVSVLFRAVRRLRPNARVVLQDPWSLFEVELREGHIVAVARTAIDGSVTHGAPTLMSLAGMSSGRYVVAEPLASLASDAAPFDEEFEAATRRLSELIAKLVDTPDCRVDLDPAVLTTYLPHSPAGIQQMIARLSAGEPPRALWETGDGSRGVVDALLVTLARQGAVRDVRVVGEQEVTKAEREPERPIDPLERENFRAQWAISMHGEPANPAPKSRDTIWRRAIGQPSENDELVSGFRLEMPLAPKILGLGFALVFCATVGFLVWREWARRTAQVSPAPQPTSRVAESPPELIAPPVEAAAPAPSRTGLSAYAGELRAGVPSSLAVSMTQGVLELTGPVDIMAQVNGIDRGPLPVTLVLEDGQHTVRYSIGDAWTYRVYYVKPGATRVLRAFPIQGGFVDAR